jgi:hypothetical protein
MAATECDHISLALDRASQLIVQDLRRTAYLSSNEFYVEEIHA